jgi:hypothetical protein
MRYEDLVIDFAERTKKNLVAIEKMAEAENQEEKLEKRKAFEITQLINSCLGLIAMPREKDFDKIPKIPLEELEKEGWPIPSLINPSERKSGLTLQHLVKYLRNAVCHFHLEFLEHEYQIIGLKMWNEVKDEDKNKENDHKKIREASLSIEDLRLLIEKFSKVIADNLKEQP